MKRVQGLTFDELFVSDDLETAPVYLSGVGAAEMAGTSRAAITLAQRSGLIKAAAFVKMADDKMIPVYSPAEIKRYAKNCRKRR